MTFKASKAVRSKVPLFVGLVGPSGSGKTYTALELGTGMVKANGGKILMLDTEARRGLHYADKFDFLHAPFEAPFSSARYLEACRWAVNDQGASVVIIDSASHEHEGEGGYLESHEAELTRLAGNDYAKRDRVNMLAWAKPAAARRAFINGLLQLEASFIFCFRAKEKIKMVPGKQPLDLGWMPIAGDALSFEMALTLLFPPGAAGVPDLRPEAPGSRSIVKLPYMFRDLFREGEAVTAKHGEALAQWAHGERPNPPKPAPAQPAPAAPKSEPGFMFPIHNREGSVVENAAIGDWERKLTAALTGKALAFSAKVWEANLPTIEDMAENGSGEVADAANRVAAAWLDRVKSV